MNPSRIGAIAIKTFVSLRHDPRSLALMLMAPILAMFIFGIAFAGEVQHVPVVIVNKDSGDHADLIIAHLDTNKLDMTTQTDLTAARQAVIDGTATAVIHFPASFTDDSTSTPGSPGSPGTGGVGATAATPPSPPAGTTIDIYLDQAEPQLALAVRLGLADAVRAFAEAEGATSPIEVATEDAYGAGAEVIDAFVPGLIPFAALLFTTLLTLLAFVGERTTGTLDRLRVTPATEGEIVSGYMLAFGLIGAVQGSLLLGAAIVLFDVLVVGNVLIAGLLSVLMALDAVALGILVSAAAQREGQAVQFIPFIVLPTFLLSGIFLPVISLPAWLQPVAYAWPPTWAVAAMRDVMLRGWGLAEVWPAVAVLVGFAVAFTALAVVGLKRAR